ncbi:MAG: hypothetical protein ABSF77_17785 [Spirochaetia bacterium]|jgi:hypothetical protein
MNGRSTGECQHNTALLAVAEWLRDEIPKPWSHTRRPVDEVLHVDAILSSIRISSLTAKDAERVVSALKDQELIEAAVMKAGLFLVGELRCIPGKILEL